MYCTGFCTDFRLFRTTTLASEKANGGGWLDLASDLIRRAENHKRLLGELIGLCYLICEQKRKNRPYPSIIRPGQSLCGITCTHMVLSTRLRLRRSCSPHRVSGWRLLCRGGGAWHLSVSAIPRYIHNCGKSARKEHGACHGSGGPAFMDYRARYIIRYRYKCMKLRTKLKIVTE